MIASGLDHGGRNRQKGSAPVGSELWVTCALGPYNFEYMTKVTEEIVTHVQSGRHLHESLGWFRHVLLRTLPGEFRELCPPGSAANQDPQNPKRRAIHCLARAATVRTMAVWDSQIKAINPNASYIANAGGGALKRVGYDGSGPTRADPVCGPPGAPRLVPPWENGKNGKEYRATMGRKAIAGIFSVGLEEQYRWKDSVQNGDEIRMWVADGMAQGLRLWFTKFNAKPIDKRWLPVVEELYNWNYANEKYLRNVDPLARVAMVYSQQTAAFYGGAKSAR